MNMHNVQILPHEKLAEINGANFLNELTMRKSVPALFSQSPHPKMSDRYGFTNTYELLLHTVRRGYAVHSVQQVGKSAYSKTLTRLRSKQLANAASGDCAELVIIDSHDGTSAITMALGWFRFVCANGMIAGESVFQRKFKHTQDDIVEQLVLSLDEATQASRKLFVDVQEMQQLSIDPVLQKTFAFQAAKLRWPDVESDKKLATLARGLLTIRRSADSNDSLHSTNL